MREEIWQTDKYCVEKHNWGEIGKLISGKDKCGWIFGSFIKEIKSLAKTEDFELKYWKLDKPSHEPKFQVLATEYNFIIKGRIKGRIRNAEGDTEVQLKEGDYIVIKPGEIINLQEEINEEVEGMTIKVPSRHGDTIKKSFIEKLLNLKK